MKEFKKLKEFTKQVIDNRGKNPPHSPEGYLVIETASISSYTKYPDYTKCQRKVDEKTYQNWFRSGHPEEGDLLFVTVGNGIGSVSIMDNNKAVIAQNIIGIRLKDESCPMFYYYYFSTKQISEYLKTLDIGSAQPSLKVPHLLEVEIPEVDKSTQENIAEVLSSLDDKIDLLHRQNKTLEQMAETLFRQWFVEEEKEDWVEMAIEDVADINPETISKKFEFAKIEYLDTGSITKGAIDSYLEVELSEAPTRAQRRVRDNDIVFSLVRPNQCHYGILNGTKPNTIVSTGFCVIRATKSSPFFLYFLLTNPTNVEYLHSIAEGSTSTYPSLRPDDIAKFTFNLPPEDLCNNFHVQVSSIWEKIFANQRQIKKLSSLRDMLLPKLMNGSLRLTNN